MRGLSTGEANVGEEGDSGKYISAPNHADVWGRFCHALEADLGESLPTVGSMRQAQDSRDANKRNLENSKQCSSVTTQTDRVDEAGSHPKDCQQCLSATTQTDLLPSLDQSAAQYDSSMLILTEEARAALERLVWATRLKKASVSPG
jgi:hypothetical protein